MSDLSLGISESQCVSESEVYIMDKFFMCRILSGEKLQVCMLNFYISNKINIELVTN